MLCMLCIKFQLCHGIYYVVNDKIIITLQVRIPSADTTYWCKTQRLPQEVIDQTHYITSVSEIHTEREGACMRE